LRDVNTICRRSWYIAAHVWKIYDFKIEVVPLMSTWRNILTCETGVHGETYRHVETGVHGETYRHVETGVHGETYQHVKPEYMEKHTDIWKPEYMEKHTDM
jgi:hypothetical protein